MGDLGPAARRRRRRHAANRALRRPSGYSAIATAGRSSRASRASPPPTRLRSCSRSSGSSPSTCRYSAVASTRTRSPFAPSRPPPSPACSLRFARTVTLSGCGAWREHSGRECSLRLDAGVSPAHPHTLALGRGPSARSRGRPTLASTGQSRREVSVTRDNCGSSGPGALQTGTRALASGHKRARESVTRRPRGLAWMPAGPASCFWRGAGADRTFSGDLLLPRLRRVALGAPRWCP